jgi:hypothetical protein
LKSGFVALVPFARVGVPSPLLSGFIPQNSGSFALAHFRRLPDISPTYKPFPWMTTYFTYNFSESTNSGNGASYGPTFLPGDFHQQNRHPPWGP